MNWQILTWVAGLALTAWLLKRLFWRGKKPSRFPFQLHSLLFSADDRTFFRTLQLAVGDDFEIFGKIPVGDIIVPKQGASEHSVNHALSLIEGRHFDFILCEKHNLAVVCAVQLHGQLHFERQHEPDPVMPLCENLGLPLVNFPVMAEYSCAEIREKLLKAVIKEPFLIMETHGRKEPHISSIDNVKL